MFWLRFRELYFIDGDRIENDCNNITNIFFEYYFTIDYLIRSHNIKIYEGV